MANEDGQRRARQGRDHVRDYTGGSGGGGQQGNAAAGMLASIMAAIPGIPGDIATIIGQIVSEGGPPDQLQAKAFSYLKGTDWFNQTYVGFNQGSQSGLWGGSLGDLVSYRQWRNSIKDTYTQSYGRDATSDEITQFATSGYDANTVGQVGQGHAFAVANSANWQYLAGNFDVGQLSDQEKEAYGQLLAGRSSALGLRVQERIQAAMQRVQSLFGGQLAGGGISQQAGFSPSLQGGPQKTDVGA